MLIPILFVWIFVYLIFQKKGFCWRRSFLLASVLSGVILTAGTEFLSLFTSLSRLSLFLFWSAAASVAILTHFLTPGREKRRPSDRLSRTLQAWLGGVMLIVLLTGITAVVAPPSNSDSMTYHMPRVMHWIQNGSVAHYPTHILRQLELNPWSEFAVTHLVLLAGSDRFVNLVQWMSMIGSLIGVSLIAREFGLGKTGQIITVVVCATIPMGILQASSTQNDYVVAFWLVTFIYFGIRTMTNPGRLHLFAAAAGLGLALLTKGTAYIFAFPFIVLFLIRHIKSFGSKYVPLIFAAAALTVLINLGHWTRNVMLFSNPLSSGQFQFFNEEIGAASLLSNVIRNLSLHIGTPFEGVNHTLTSAIEDLHGLLGIDPHDPRSTWVGGTFAVPILAPHEDISGNFLHLVLILFSGGILLLKKEFRRHPITGYLIATISGFMLFCLLLKWQLWHSRFHLSLFVLGSPLIGAVISEFLLKKSSFFVSLVMTGLLVSSVPWVIFNVSRPLVPLPMAGIHSILHLNTSANPQLSVPMADIPSIFRQSRLEMYLPNRPEYAGTMEKIKRIKSQLEERGCYDIGLETTEMGREYPFWVILNEKKKVFRIEHVHVTNVSGKMPLQEFTPCAIIQIE